MSDARDAYLDRLFDRLAGTGAQGRRALVEADSHLADSIEALVAQGRTPEAAAKEAVERFGSAEKVAAAHLKASALPLGAVVQRLFAGGWLLAGAGFSAIGLSGVLTLGVAKLFGAGWVAFDGPNETYPALRCAQLLQAYSRASGCRAASLEHHAQELVFGPVVLGVIGLLLLAGFWLARRSPLRGLTVLPPAGLLAAAGCTAFLLAAKALAALGLLGLLEGSTAGVGTDFARAFAALVMGLVFAPRLFSELRLRRT